MPNLFYTEVKSVDSAEEEAACDLPGADSFPAGVLGRAGMRDPAALRYGKRGGHLQPRHLPARARTRAVERGLRGAFPAPDRRPLRRKPEPAAALLPVPGDHQAFPHEHPRPLPRFAARLRHRSRTKHDIRFVEDDWESPTLGAWGSAGRSGWTAWRSPSSPTSSRRAAST